MRRIAQFCFGIVLGCIAVAPSTALALGLSFGGTILAALPCVSPAGPAVWIKILPAGGAPLLFYVWTSGSLGLPPTHAGQQILGVADVPMACGIPGPHGIAPLPPGERIQIDGVSI